MILQITGNTTSRAPWGLYTAKDAKLPNDTRSMFFIILLVVTVRVKVWQTTQQTSTIPHRIPLHLVTDHIDLESTRPHQTATCRFARSESLIHNSTQVFLETLTKVLEHGASTAEDNVLVESTTDVDGRLLNHAIHHFRKRGEEVGRRNFGVEKDLGRKESFVPHIDRVLATSDGVFAFETFKVLVRVFIVSSKFADNVLADIRVVLLDLLCHPTRVFGWNVGRFAAFSKQLLDKVGDIPSGNGDMLDSRADNIPFSHRDHVGDTITRINDRTCQRSIGHLVARPRGRQRQHCLHCNVQSLDVETLKHDLCRILSVLGRIERRLSKHEVVVFRFSTEILEDALLPESFHVIPVFDQAMTDGLVDLVGFGVGIGFVADEKVEVFNAAFGSEGRGGGESAWFGGDRGARACAGGRASGGCAGRDGGRKDKGGVRVAGKSHLGISRTIVEDDHIGARHIGDALEARVNRVKDVVDCSGAELSIQ